MARFTFKLPDIGEGIAEDEYTEREWHDHLAYALLAEDLPRGVLTRWRDQVPAGFEFTIKAWQIVTHESTSPTYRRLKQPLPDSARGQVGAFRTATASCGCPAPWSPSSRCRRPCCPPSRWASCCCTRCWCWPTSRWNPGRPP